MAAAEFPCSICADSFATPKDLATHILQKHCGNEEKTTVMEVACTDKTIVMDVDPLEHNVIKTEIADQQCLDDTILPVLPRTPTVEEQKQKFLMYNLPTDPANFMRYVCLLCSKLYTSRYNIRMHLNSHTGRNVHTCPYCNIQFTSRQCYEGHIRSHTDNMYKDDDDIADDDEDEDLEEEEEDLEEDEAVSGPQIVSVKSISKAEEADLEVKNERGHHLPIMAAPVKTSTIQIRPLSQMAAVSSPPTPVTLVKPSVTYNCSFCNSKHPSQDDLIKHLGQHVNFATPSGQDLEKGFMSLKVPSNVNPGSFRIKFMCLSCGKSFAKETQVKIHLNVHYGDNIYNCRFCEKVFANYQAFEEHVKSHSEEYKFNCKYCNASFINRNVMVTHQKTCPFSTHPQQPDTCQESPPPAAKKVKILLTGEGIKNFIKAKDAELSLASSVSNNNDNTASSYSSDEDKSLVQQVVRKRAPIFPFEPEDHYVPDNNSNNIIPKHEIVPAPTTVEKRQGYCLRPFKETGQQRYICTVCGKHYTTMYNMRQHRNIHTGRGLHSCRYCGRSFTHKHVWETHERIHTGERPFRCPSCPKDFADRSNYNSHRKLCAIGRKK